MNAAGPGDDADDDGKARTAAVLADAAHLTGAPCRACGARLCGHEAVFALVLGYKDAPHCLACTAAHMQEALAGLRERALVYVQHHPCFHAAWRRAGAEDHTADVERPACVFGAVAAPVVVPVEPLPMAAAADAFFDAGSTGCGDLVLELRQRFAALAAGGVLELRAEDPGAPVDLPAWCQLTGHTLLEARHPIYRIRRKG